MKVGDLAKFTSHSDEPTVLLLQRDIKTELGTYWWRVIYNNTGKTKIVGEWELEVISESR